MAAIADRVSSSQGTLPVCLRKENFNRPVSLWDVLRINAQNFIELFELLAQMRGSLEVLTRFTDMKGHMHSPMTWNNADDREKVKRLGDVLLSMGLTYSHAATVRLVEHFESQPSTMSVLAQLGGIQDRIRDEIGNQHLLRIEADRVNYFENVELFGRSVFDSFPSANDDLCEAGACLALDRGTACIMHLSRMQESALKVLARDLGIGQQNDWGRYLKQIEDELQSRFKKSGARTPDEQFYAEAWITFDAVRRAWRNPSMHVEKSYSPERAEEILQSVGALMKHLATRLRE